MLWVKCFQYSLFECLRSLPGAQCGCRRRHSLFPSRREKSLLFSSVMSYGGERIQCLITIETEAYTVEQISSGWE